MLFSSAAQIFSKKKLTRRLFGPRGTPFPNPETGIETPFRAQKQAPRASGTLQDKGFGIQDRLRRRGSRSFTVSAIGGKKLSIE